ncbi:MAG: formyl transferase [Deltaproteobacteria bacterium]|nr:formyl transferase [Deltaproteobacteria bacterium]
MHPVPLFDPDKVGRPMRVAAFMSGSGTNIVRLIELEKILRAKEGTPPFEVAFIFSDRSDGTCHGEKIACERAIPYISLDIRTFHRLRGLKRNVAVPEGLHARREFDKTPATLIRSFDIDVVALGGYMSYTTIERCINVHPADLSILTSDGKRRYVGDHAVLDAIAAGETSLRSSTIWTDQGVDTGPVLMISKPLPVELPLPLDDLRRNRERLIRVSEEHQARLKETGDWKIFPRTVEMIARGRFALDPMGMVYVDGLPVPAGYREDGE